MVFVIGLCDGLVFQCQYGQIVVQLMFGFDWVQMFYQFGILCGDVCWIFVFVLVVIGGGGGFQCFVFSGLFWVVFVKCDQCCCVDGNCICVKCQSFGYICVGVDFV